ncbi:MAG: galactose mutarotase, partial [Oribacterium sinus]|nr:galactose mutarotase [Oribacterium sinus]
HSGYCFETQYYPNAINVPTFLSPIVAAGSIYRSETIYRFRQRLI